MSIAESSLQSIAHEAWQLVEIALAAQDLEEFAEDVLPTVARTMRPSSASLYITAPRPPSPHSLQHDPQPEAVSETESLCLEDLSDRVMTDDVLARLTTFSSAMITIHRALLTREALCSIADTTMENIRELEQGKRMNELTNCVGIVG